LQRGRNIPETDVQRKTETENKNQKDANGVNGRQKKKKTLRFILSFIHSTNVSSALGLRGTTLKMTHPLSSWTLYFRTER
jgi:hypothetical protein